MNAVLNVLKNGGRYYYALKYTNTCDAQCEWCGEKKPTLLWLTFHNSPPLPVCVDCQAEAETACEVSR